MLEDPVIMEKLQESSGWLDEAKNLAKGLVDLKKMCVLYPLQKSEIDEAEERISATVEDAHRRMRMRSKDSIRSPKVKQNRQFCIPSSNLEMRMAFTSSLWKQKSSLLEIELQLVIKPEY